MLNQSWFRNQNNVVCCRKEEVLPRLARELAIPDLSQRVEEFQKTPTAEGVNISGRKRTTLKLLIPNLTFSEPIDMGENVWIYMGELCPAYCLYMPQVTVKKRNEADEGEGNRGAGYPGDPGGGLLVWWQCTGTPGMDSRRPREQPGAGEHTAQPNTRGNRERWQ